MLEIYIAVYGVKIITYLFFMLVRVILFIFFASYFIIFNFLGVTQIKGERKENVLVLVGKKT